MAPQALPGGAQGHRSLAWSVFWASGRVRTLAAPAALAPPDLHAQPLSKTHAKRTLGGSPPCGNHRSGLAAMPFRRDRRLRPCREPAGQGSMGTRLRWKPCITPPARRWPDRRRTWRPKTRFKTTAMVQSVLSWQLWGIGWGPSTRYSTRWLGRGAWT